MKLDKFDIKILQILQQDGRITKSNLAQTINLSVSPCWERVKRLEQAGIIEGYGARINPDAVVKLNTVLVEITLGQHDVDSFQRFERAMQVCDDVKECWATGGGIDYIVRLGVTDIDYYQRLIDSWLTDDLGIKQYYTYIVTKQVKRPSLTLPLETPDIAANG
ncbi:AsnC family transcriptional regulator [Salinivibrio kushneri]|uniref:AsnC family transcriptional regulator n=1 Tax=Salinivibrio kushneri TaxID=1908198 RepID=A0AB36K9G3_9GAMM|nr:Lrp/AsnC family transcriptional regulator [Salinivibrio kushneri]OOE43174.1 AsnC family transcriptional regulator [Salinivibrio kushneri]OOE45365.1 AsnC family transcriptional regulator [Salinivibrio kushneri]